MRTLFAFLLVVSLLSCPLRADPPSDPVGLGHGINLGNYLEGPHEGDWSEGRKLTEIDFAIIRQAGFQTVRVPICWSNHLLNDPAHTIDPAFLARIDWVVAQVKANGLTALLDNHNDNALMKDPDAESDRFLAIWRQVAGHFKNEPPTILFELMNEPKEKMDAGRWNKLIIPALSIIRQTNPDRWVVVGGAYWNAIKGLDSLELPENDRRLIATFHYYDPIIFTHQGADWLKGSNAWLGNKWLGTYVENGVIAANFDKAAAWGHAHHRPLLLGEFGTYSKCDFDSRVRWTTAVARAADARGIPYAYWEFNSGFGAYDPKAHQWRAPLLNALMPGAKP